jgi:hypothetical protein
MACGGGGSRPVDPAVTALSRFHDATLSFSATLHTCEPTPTVNYDACTRASRRAYLAAASRATRALGRRTSPAPCASAKADALALVRQVSTAFGREWAATGSLLRAIRAGRRLKRAKEGESLPELAADSDAARDETIHSTARLVGALRANC